MINGEKCDKTKSPEQSVQDTPRQRCCGSSPTYSEDMVMLATSIASFLARGKTICELETLVNLAGLVKSTLLSILTQRAICSRGNTTPQEEIDV